MADQPTFPYEIHPLANLGPMDEKAILELMDDITKVGYLEEFPIMLLSGKVLDGRHRQEACLRLGIVPPVKNIKPRGGAASFVAIANSLKTYRDISVPEKMIYGAENFTDESPSAVQKKLGFVNGQYPYIVKAYKKSRRSKLKPNPWNEFKAGRLTQIDLFATFGIERKSGGNSSVYREQYEDLVDEHHQTVSEVEDLREKVATRESYIKDLEKRLKALDPQERIARAAEGITTSEDRLRDRLEFTEEELKKSRKINEQFAGKVRDLERLHYTFDNVFSGVDWSSRRVAPPVFENTGKSRPHEFLALMSDAHYGEVVEPSEALGLSYNSDIAKARIEHYRDTVIKYKDLRAPAYNIDKLTVAVLGDMLSGNIHDELRVYNEKNMTEQSADMTNILLDLAQDFASEFPQVEFVIIPGNHPRLFKKPEFKAKWDNYEVAMGNAVQIAVERAKWENVKITVPKDMVYIHDIFGYRIGMYHGDGVKSNSFAGIPFYGLRQRREAIQALLSSLGLERIDMLVMGHFHQHLYWAGECDVLINGAIKGGDEYSIGSFSSAPEPIQVLLEWHPEHGLTAQEHISLGHIN